MTGFNVRYLVGQSWTSPGGLQRQLGVNAQVLNAGVSLNYALIRLLERNLFLNASMLANNASADAMGRPVTRASTRRLSLGAKYDDELFGVKFILNPAYVKGLDASGQDLVNSGFSALTLNGTLSTSLTDTLAAKLRFSGQYGLTRLPVALLASFGGSSLGRAYDPGAISGNNAIMTAGEIDQAIETHIPWRRGLNLFVYGGAVWNPSGSAQTYASLASMGIGDTGRDWRAADGIGAGRRSPFPTGS